MILIFLSSALAFARQTPTTAQPSATTGQSTTQQNTKPTHNEEIVVTGTYDPLPLDEVDRAVAVIDIGQTPTVYRNWMDVLRNDSSVDIQQRAPGVQGDLSIRGSTFGQVLVLINGVRVNDVQTGHHNLDLPIPFESMQRVEVLHGSGSTLYGSDALGGAVNFITAPATHDELRIGAGVGNYGTNRQDGAVSILRGWFGEQAAFTRELSTGFIPDRDYRNLAISSETTARTRLGLSDVLLAYSDRPFGADDFYGPYNSWERTKAWFAAAQQALGANTSALFAYRRHSDNFILLRDMPDFYANEHIDESYQAALRRNDQVAKNARVFYGVEGFHDSIDSNNLGHHKRDRGAIYGDLDVRAVKRFSFAIGARQEFFTGGQQDFSPTVSGGYWLSHRVKLKASASHAFRLPSYTDLYYSDPANAGNPNLRPEKAWEYEGGALVTFTSRMSGEFTVFNRRVHDGIDYVRANAGEIWQAANLTNVNFTGFEVATHIEATRSQRFDVAYTFLHGAQNALNGLQSKFIFNYPTNAGSASWFGTLPGKITTRARIQAIQRYKSDVYPLLDLSLTREFRMLQPYVQLTNLTNTGYAELAGPPAVRMPGRGVIVGVEVVLQRK
ncbi:MAG TPA: TonB-dependent receptor [Candidatus Acidoferrales bacterium]|nr:TonB-dependent receptor [Candidatus Acidoferrales bacterium]